MPKNTVSVEIKRIPLDVEIPELGYVEIADLAAQVEKEMERLQEEEGVIDTLKQALLVALEFAAKDYLKQLSDGGKQKEDSSRVDQLISKLQGVLVPPAK
ncbi:cell division protein ZapA [Candidatus Avelusimicrobium facis]|mgnify:CR=1 FL=1|uniref:cell division protein ZapA n=1 Tax=Candidatus Avelusimicrobium facis TaxID=3416203 RepID=UPI003D0CC5B3